MIWLYSEHLKQHMNLQTLENEHIIIIIITIIINMILFYTYFKRSSPFLK